jgi:hypothetical protein
MSDLGVPSCVTVNDWRSGRLAVQPAQPSRTRFSRAGLDVLDAQVEVPATAVEQAVDAAPDGLTVAGGSNAEHQTVCRPRGDCFAQRRLPAA